MNFSRREFVGVIQYRSQLVMCGCADLGFRYNLLARAGPIALKRERRPHPLSVGKMGDFDGEPMLAAERRMSRRSAGN